MKIQKSVKGRKQVSARVLGEIRKIVERESERFDVSKSFVISVALADYFGVKNQEKYE